MQLDELEQAFDEGWTTVAMSQESSQRPMLDAAEAAEFAGQERGYDLMGARWPVNTLCQLSLREEQATAIWESMAVHHRELVAAQWSARTVDECWRLSGDLDAHVAREFGAAVHGALRAAWRFPDRPDLDVDLSEVTFMDVACAQIMMLAARSTARHQRMILHRAPPVVRELLAVVGTPRSVSFGAEAVRRTS
jgi:anti-anti-sigma regulatory factor